jgi:cytochrome c556
MVQLISKIALSTSMMGVPALADIADKDVIDYREHIMKTLNEQAEALGMILSTTIPDDNAAAHLEIIALTASTALKAFEAKIQGGESKSTVWSNWPDFAKRMNEFSARTAEAAKLAKEKGAKAGLTDIDSTLTCKSCHEIYREEKKK